MPQTFLTQISDLLGESATGGDIAITSTALDDLCTHGARIVIQRTPKQLWERFTTISTFAPTTGQQVRSRKISMVLRNDGSFDIPCREIPRLLASRAIDTRDLEYITKDDPAYYWDISTSSSATPTVMVLPVSTTTSLATIHYVALPTVSSTSATIKAFPDELEYLIPIYGVANVKLREVGKMRRNSQDNLGYVTGTLTTSLGTAFTDVETALDAITTQMGNATTPITLANTEFDSATGRIASAKVEFGLIPALLTKGEVTGGTLTNINDALSRMATLVKNATNAIIAGDGEITIGSKHLDGLAAIATGGTISKFATAIADVQTDMDLAVSILGGVSPATNAVDVIFAIGGGTATSVVTDLKNEDVELAQTGLALGQARIQEAGGHIAAGQGKIAEANAQLGHLRAYVDVSANPYFANAESYFRKAQNYLSVVDKQTIELQSILSHIGEYRAEAQGRVNSGVAYLQEANARLAQGNAYLSEAQADIAVAGGYAAEAQSRLGKAGAYIQEAGVRLQVAGSFDQKSGAALAESQQFFARFDKGIQDWIGAQ